MSNSATAWLYLLHLQVNTRPKRYTSCSKEAPFLQGKIAFLNKAKEKTIKFLTSTIELFRESEFADHTYTTDDDDDYHDDDLDSLLSSRSASDSDEESDD